MSILTWWTQYPQQRRRRLVLLIIQLALLGSIFWAVRGTLFPYFLGMGLAYLLFPLVELIEIGFRWISRRPRLGFLRGPARPLAILISYLLLIAVIAGFISMVVPMVADQAKALWDARDSIWNSLSHAVENLLEQYRLLPEQVRTQAEQSLTKLTTWLTDAVEQALKGTVVAITYTASLVLAILIVPFWTFYLLKDYAQLKKSAYTLIPTSWHSDLQMVLRLIDRTLSSYLRGQLFLGVIIGTATAIGLSVIGVRFSLLLGFLAGVLELIPNIGPTVAAVIAILVAIPQGPTTTLFTAGFAILIQQIENLFLTPRVLGESVKLHPVVVMVVLVVGSELGGVVGLFLAPVITALLRDLFKYAYYRLGDEPLTADQALHKVYRQEAFSVDV